ncbi:unnamed protein product [Meganyctiphanes norvegica]|uniref:lysozyme n=1 Tax=Meganyctiphanes norvegica TaxID=48144 RepID=A0AAV2RPF0_MEGNR
MSLPKSVLVTFAFALVACVVYGQNQSQVSPNCMGCICEASSNCNSTMGCSTPYPGGYFCGPFLISLAYWTDAGKPVLQHDDPEKKGAFENCVTDLYCAADTLRRYMKKFSSNQNRADCNNDGKVDCVDFAYMHLLGGYGCKDPSIVTTDYFTKFQTCWNVVNSAQPSG